ncbi:MAG TPA: hypothetical protein VG347_14515 [Verrucomicrobiae bacterium]|nr:hypothetical protein [Verrucomicrobiae bacterium]
MKKQSVSEPEIQLFARIVVLGAILLAFIVGLFLYVQFQNKRHEEKILSDSSAGQTSPAGINAGNDTTTNLIAPSASILASTNTPTFY